MKKRKSQINAKDLNKVLQNIKNRNQLQKPSFDTFKAFNEKFNIIYDFFVRITVISALITLFSIFFNGITSNKYVLTSIEVSNLLKDEIDGNDIKSNIATEIREILDNSKNATYNAPTGINSISDETIPLQISGFDLNQIFVYLRRFFNVKNREIKINLMPMQNNYKLVVGIGDNSPFDKYFPISDEGRKAINIFLAEQILKYNAPYKLGLYFIEKGNTPKLAGIIEYLEELKINESKWDSSFSQNRWYGKKIHLQATDAYASRDYVTAKLKFEEILKTNTDNGIVWLELAQTYNQLIESARTDRDFISDDTIKKYTSRAIEISENVINKDLYSTFEKYENESEMVKSIKSTAFMVQADAFNTLGKLYKKNNNKKASINNFKKSDRRLEQAISILPDGEHTKNAGICNWAANIKMGQGDQQDCNNLIAAKMYIKRALLEKPEEGNYYDTFAEIYLNLGNTDSLFVNLEKALKHENKDKGITKNDYKKDKRWTTYKEYPQFKLLVD